MLPSPLHERTTNYENLLHGQEGPLAVTDSEKEASADDLV